MEVELEDSGEAAMTDCRCHSHNGFVLSPEGLAQRKSLRSTGLTDRDFFAILDTRVSVSGLRRDEYPMFPDEATIDEQYRRFLEQSEVG